MTFQGDSNPASGERRAGQPGRTKSMHEGVPDWYDCCSCEMEPYWCEATGDIEQAEGGAPSRERDGPADH